MGSKEEYEARKAERKNRENLPYKEKADLENMDMVDLFDRFVTAVERIADSLEKK